jgi:hypothetical protein
MTTIKLKEYDLLGQLGNEEDALDSFVNDYTDSNHSYVCDIISEVADSSVPIYYNEIWEDAREIEEYIGEAIAQGLYEVSGTDFDLHKLFQAGYYQYYTQSLYQNLDEMVFNFMADMVNEYLDNLDENVIAELDLVEVEDKIEQYADNFDHNDKIGDIIDEADDIIEYIKSEIELVDDEEE